jgi:hypothetical protein
VQQRKGEGIFRLLVPHAIGECWLDFWMNQLTAVDALRIFSYYTDIAPGWAY